MPPTLQVTYVVQPLPYILFTKGRLKGTGTQRFDLTKSGIIGKILMRRAHGRPLQIFKVFLYIFNYYFKKFSGTGKNYA